MTENDAEKIVEAVVFGVLAAHYKRPTTVGELRQELKNILLDRPDVVDAASERGEAVTLEQIRAALPTHIMLTPGVHRWQEGDDWLELLHDELTDVTTEQWRIVQSPLYGKPVGRYEVGYAGNTMRRYCVARRPIPPHILDNQAFWIWRGDKQEYPTAAELAEVGGIDSWRAQIIAGRLYDKWLLEQMEGV